MTSALMFLLTSTLAGLDIATFINNYNDFGLQASFSNGLIALPNTFESLIQLIKAIPKNNEYYYLFEFFLLPLKILKIFVPVTFVLIILVTPLKEQALKVAAILLIGNFSHITSGYIYLIYILIVPFLMREVELRKGIYLLLIIFVLPIDWVMVPSFSANFEFVNSYLGGAEIYNVDFWIGIGSLVRPVSNFILMCLMFKYIITSKNA